MAKEKIIYPANRASKTKLGVKPRQSEEKTVTIKSPEGTISRQKWSVANLMVTEYGWMFCPKSEYKQK